YIIKKGNLKCPTKLIVTASDLFLILVYHSIDGYHKNRIINLFIKLLKEFIEWYQIHWPLFTESVKILLDINENDKSGNLSSINRMFIPFLVNDDLFLEKKLIGEYLKIILNEHSEYGIIVLGLILGNFIFK